MKETQNNPANKKGSFRNVLATGGVVVASIYAAGYLVGNKVSSKPDVDVRLQQIIKPQAISIARTVLKQNMLRNNNIVITRPTQDSNGTSQEIASISSIVNNEWITVDVDLYRDQNGQLDPTTVNEVGITTRDCDPPGPHGVCGGVDHTWEEVELIYGDDTTFTKGNWGATDELTVAGYHKPNITVNSATHNPTELSDTPDAKHAIMEARLLTKVAQISVNAVLNGKIDLPKPKK